MQSLAIKSVLVFLLKVIKWTFIFFLTIAIRTIVVSSSFSFFPIVLQVLRVVFVSFPAICTLSFIGALIFLMKKKNASYAPLFSILFFLLIVAIFLQPLLYSLADKINLGELQSSNSASINNFIEPTSSLKELVKDIYTMLNDGRQAYFEGYYYYLFFALSYTFFLFSLSFFSLKAKWNMFNVFFIFLLLVGFVYVYSIMNIAERQLYIFSASTIALSGIPTYIITIGIASLLSLYGIASRLKWDGKKWV